MSKIIILMKLNYSKEIIHLTKKFKKLYLKNSTSYSNLKSYTIWRIFFMCYIDFNPFAISLSAFKK